MTVYRYERSETNTDITTNRPVFSGRGKQVSSGKHRTDEINTGKRVEENNNCFIVKYTPRLS